MKTVWRVVCLFGLGLVAFGAGVLEPDADGRMFLRLAAVGAVVVFFVMTYLWWKLLGMLVRFALLVFSAAALFVLLRSMGALA